MRAPSRIHVHGLPKARVAIDDSTDSNVANVEEVEVIRKILPYLKKKRIHDWIPPLRIPLFLHPFSLLAWLFRYHSETLIKDGFRRPKRAATFVVPLCICPDVTFYIINFLHTPIIGYLLFSGWYTIAFRELLMGLITEEASGAYQFTCNLGEHAVLAIYGIGVDGRRAILMAVVIFALATVGAIGFYTDTKLLLGLWFLMGGAIYLEYYLAYQATPALLTNDCYRSIHQLGYCFLSNIDAYRTNLESYHEYGPARAIDLLQYSLECCGAFSLLDYGPNDTLSIPSSCTNIFWNRNIYSMQAQTLHDVYGRYIYQTGCMTNLVIRCRSIRGLGHFGLRPIFLYHVFLYIIGVIAIILYCGMQRTHSIYSYVFNETIRNYTFPKESTIVIQNVGERYHDGKIEPADLLRLHLQSEFIQNYDLTAEHLSMELPPDTERFIAKLRYKLDIGNEDLGMYGGYEAPAPTKTVKVQPASESDDTGGIAFLHKTVKATGNLNEKAAILVSADRSKYFLNPASIKLAGKPGEVPDFNLTEEKAQAQLREGGTTGRTKSLWKWEEKDRLDVSTLVDQAKKDVAYDAEKKRAAALGLPPPPPPAEESTNKKEVPVKKGPSPQDKKDGPQPPPEPPST